MVSGKDGDKPIPVRDDTAKVSMTEQDRKEATFIEVMTGPELEDPLAYLELEEASNLSEAETLTALKEAGGIKLDVGEKLYAKVEENGSTGYIWLLDPQCDQDTASISSVVLDPNDLPTEAGVPSEIDASEGELGMVGAPV